MLNMDKKNYCSCPFCESVFILRQSLSKVICGNCGEMFDARLNRVIRVENRFIPDVGIHSSLESSDNSLPPRITLRGQRASDKSPMTEVSDEFGQDESLNLKIESRPDKKTQRNRPPYLRDPAVPITDNVQAEPDELPNQDSEVGRWTDSLVEERNDRPLSNRDYRERPQDKSPDNRMPSGFEKIGKKRLKKRANASPASSYGLDRIHQQKSQVTSLIADRGNPASVIVWSVVCIAFLFILVAQIESFVVPKYAQTTKYRPYLETFCLVVQCELPLFKDVENLKLMHTSIALHPSQPGAVRIQVRLINEARHAQPYPELQLTLTDKFGRIVGKRIYEPSVYLQDDVENKMKSDRLSSVNLDLAKPHENAYGFAVDVVNDA